MSVCPIPGGREDFLHPQKRNSTLFAFLASRKRENVEEYPVKRLRKSRSCEEEKEMLVNVVDID